MRKRIDHAMLPNRIREHRVARGLTLKEVAHTVRCSIVQLSDLERGNRRLTTAWRKRVGRALGVDPDQLSLPSEQDALSEEERELVHRYRFGSNEQQWMILSIARIINRVPI